VIVAMKTKGEIPVGTQKRHVAYQKIKFVLDFLFWIFSLGSKVSTSNSSSQAINLMFDLNMASNNWKYSNS